ncbi:MAG TPA: HEAT repeat domain-containing protein [Pyrinomonadaceae bacterium]|jgi:HEAT repeat protein
MLETFKLIHPRTRAARRAGLIATLALVSLGLSLTALRPRAAYGVPQESARKLNRLVAQSGSTPAMKVFAEGRDFLDNNEWAKAAERFQTFIKNYPNDKDVDAAYYWLAYSLNKQGRKAEAASRASEIIREYPHSTWLDEAKALLVEAGDPQAVKRGVDNKENDEIKLIALQSLFDNNPERAMQYVSEMLKSPNTSQQMRESVVSLLGSHGGREAVPVLLQLARTDPSPRVRLTAIHRLGEEGGESVLGDLMSIYQSDQDMQVKQQVLHALSEMEGARPRALLVEVARNASENQQLRLTAIHWLGEREDSAFADLAQIYDADRSQQVRAQILHSFSEMKDPRATQKLIETARSSDDAQLRASAIHWLGERGSDAVVDELMRIYESDQSQQVKMQILHSFSEMENPRARAKLMEAARSGSDLQLRAAAIRWLIDEGDTPQTVDLLVGLYDSEKDNQVRSSILHALSESKQKGALRKLMEVARRDPSIEMRKMAIHWIGESRDPEALRFLEEILKQP